MPRYFDGDDEFPDAPGAYDPQLMRARRVIRYLLATRALAPGDRGPTSPSPGPGLAGAEQRDGGEAV